MKPKVLLFDFDGVILDTEWSIYESIRDVFMENGQELPLQVYVQCIGSDFETWSPEKHLEELTGKTFDWEAIGVKRNRWIREEIAKLDAMPGVRDTLENCREADLPCLVVSSSSHDWVDAWLEKLELTSYFSEIVCRGDAPKIKPAPDLYLEGVKRSGFAAEDCLVIEDSLNGMLSAHTAGCPVAIVANRITKCIDFSAAEFQYDSMSELLKSL